MKPSVLILCQLFYPELVSTGQTMTELAEKLSEMGAKVEVLAGPPTVVDTSTKIKRSIYYKGIHVRRVRGTRFPKLSLIGKLINQISYAAFSFFELLQDGKRTPLLVLTNPPFLGVIAAFLKIVKRRRYIYLIFDVYPETAEILGVIRKDGLVARIWTAFNRLVISNADEVVVIGRCMSELIKNKMRSARDKVTVINMWSDDELIGSTSGRSNPFISKWGLNGKFVIGYSGNIGRFHDMETIMEAARLLNGEPDVLFLIIGEGYKKKWCVDFVREHMLENVKFMTYVDRKDLGFALSTFHIGLTCLERGQEGLSVPSKTYGMMAARVPVIAVMSDFSEIARMLKEENCGFVVSQGKSEKLVSSILKLKNDQDIRATMSENAIISIHKKYNLAKSSGDFLKLIEKIQP